ncbi:MAG: hypothetical protein AAFX01_08585 [Cyanobacteria bacterium J06638_28]
MKESTNPVSSLSHEQLTELELLHSVLDDGGNYPWDVYHSSSTAYFDQLETTLGDDEFSANTFVSQWQQISQQAAQLWSETPSSLTTLLAQRFEMRMPASLLTQLAAKAQEASDSGKVLLDQLVDCAQTVLTGWAADDLQVMARPLALAMRDGHGEVLDATLRSVRPLEWQDLSEIEQARLSLAIARYALDEISQQIDS